MNDGSSLSVLEDCLGDSTSSLDCTHVLLIALLIKLSHHHIPHTLRPRISLDVPFIGPSCSSPINHVAITVIFTSSP